MGLGFRGDDELRFTGGGPVEPEVTDVGFERGLEARVGWGVED